MGAASLTAVMWAAFAVVAEEKPFYLTLDTPPAPELTPVQAQQGFSIAPGFKIELVAAEPLVEDPIALKWDEEGRLYVVEMRGYMPDAYGNGEKDPVGVITRLTDTSGDGQLDNREVLLDKLVLPRAIAIVNEGLLVGEPPNLWLCPSATGRSADIDCSAKKKLGTYGDQPGSVEHAENGLLMGIDNWLYSAKSNRRLRLVDGALEVEPTLFRGQWGIAQDNDGRLFYNTNSSLVQGDFYDAQQVIVAGNATAPGLGAQISTNDELFAVRVNTGVNRAYVPGVLKKDGRLNRPTSASGMAPYRGDQFPAGYEQDVFVAEPAANAIAQLRLSYNADDGLAIGSEHVLYPNEKWGQIEFFASTDERFRPVDVEVGPDGALYVVDMYRGIIQDHFFLSDELRAQALERQLDKPVGMGRIWRVTATEGAALRATPNLLAASVDELVALLGAANAWQRETAQRLLLNSTGSGLNRKLRKAVKTGNNMQAVHALWTLSGRKALDRKTVLAGVARDLPSVGLSAVRAGHKKLKRSDLLKLLAKTDNPRVLQQLTLSLATDSAHPDVRAHFISSVVDNADNPFRLAAIRAASLGQEVALLKGLQQKTAWSHDHESKTNFLQQLVVQGFRAHPESGQELLDFSLSRTADERWLQSAVLEGLYAVSRDDAFVRVALQQEHPIFVTKDESLWPTVARARRAFTWAGDNLAADAKPLSPNQQAARDKGSEFYLSRCASCHGEDGKGIASLAPPLADSPWVTGSSERLARIMLQGLQGPIEVAGTTWNGVMPGHQLQKEFDDEVASGLMTFLHRSWGHSGRAIDPEFIAGVRLETADRDALWTVPELMSIDTNTHYKNYTGRYGSPAFTLEFVYTGSGLEVKSGIFNGPMQPLKEDQFLFEPRKLPIEFVLDDAGQAVGLRMPNGDGEVQLPRLGD